MHIVETKTGTVPTDPREPNRAGVRAAAYAVIALETHTAIAAFGGGAAMIADFRT